MPTGWIIALVLINAYILLLVWLAKTGRMERYNLSLLLGFILMIRTTRGRKLLDRLARPKRFWNVFGDVGTVVTLVGMVLITALLLFGLFTQLRTRVGGPALGAREILIIPGVTPWLPIWYGIIALIVTLVVHEGGHGVLARANNMKVKTIGLLYAVVPVGAFVEPDEDELKAAPRRDRLRVFSAGVMVNLVVATVLLVGFAAMVDATEPVEGVGVSQVTKDMPAEQAGILPGDILVAGDGQPIRHAADFSDFMDARSPGDTVVFKRSDDTEATVTLTSRWEAYTEDQQAGILAFEEEVFVNECNAHVEPDPADGRACARALQQQAFLGIGPYPARTIQNVLGDPFEDGRHLGFYMALPLSEVLGGQPVLSVLPTFFESPWDGTALEAVYFPLAFILFWVFWINLMVGLTNILPMLPLDGGHIFRDAVGAVVAKVRPGFAEHRVESIVGRVAGAMSIFMLIAVLATFVLPHIYNRLA